MELREVLTKAAELWLDQDNRRKNGEKFTLTDREIKQFLSAAESREPAIFHEMDVFLNSLIHLYPLRAARMKKDLKWIRKMAHKRGVSLGRS